MQKQLHEQKDRVLPKSALGKAITYCLNQWNHLEAFLLDGHLEIDNNRSERSIKPFVIGRKNWMFSNTTRGARGSAIMYSVVETAKENNLSLYHYLHYLFETLPNIDLNNIEETYAKWKSGEVTAVMFMEMLELRKNTFYKIMREYEEAKWHLSYMECYFASGCKKAGTIPC